MFDYLNEPSNTLPRAGAIALGSATGFVIGLRHGAIRRLLYTAFGTTGMASICYPKDAEVYAQKGLVEAKAWAKIGYNFAYGSKFRKIQRCCETCFVIKWSFFLFTVKPGDEQPMFPKIPSNLDELGVAVKDLLNSAKDAIGSQFTKSDK